MASFLVCERGSRTAFVTVWFVMTFLNSAKCWPNISVRNVSMIDAIMTELVHEVAARPPSDSAVEINFVCKHANSSGSRLLHALADSGQLRSLEATRTIWIIKKHPLGLDYGVFNRAFVVIGCVETGSIVLRRMQAGARSRLLIFWTCSQGGSLWSQMEKFFAECWRAGILNVLVAVPRYHKSVAVYSYFPFRGPGVCFDRSPILLRLCTLHGDCKGISKMFYEDKVGNLRQCPLNVNVLRLYPYSYFDEVPGPPYHLKGLLTELFEGLVRCMKFTPKYKPANQYGNSCADEGIYRDVYTGAADIGIALSTSFTTTAFKCPTLRPQANVITCYTWCMPRHYMKNSVWMFLANEFDGATWISVCVASVVVTLFAYSFLAFNPSALPSVMHIVIVGYVPQPIRIKSAAFSVKILLIFWFLYNIVISTGYQAGLHGLNVVPDRHSFRTVYDLAYSDIPVTSHEKWRLFMLNLPDREEHVTDLANRMKPIPTRDLDQRYLEFKTLGNRAMLMPRELCVHFAESQRVHRFYYLSGYCLSTHEVLLYMLRENSPFGDTITHYNKRLFESGYNRRSMPSEMRIEHQRSQPVRALTLFHLQPFMLLLAVGCAIGLTVFICEVATHFSIHWWYVLCLYLVVNQKLGPTKGNSFMSGGG